jgi:hypothetical protein
MTICTGDLAIEDKDGFHIVGRTGFQVKIGDQKAEPEEVSAELSKCELRSQPVRPLGASSLNWSPMKATSISLNGRP